MNNLPTEMKTADTGPSVKKTTNFAVKTLKFYFPLSIGIITISWSLNIYFSFIIHFELFSLFNMTSCKSDHLWLEGHQNCKITGDKVSTKSLQQVVQPITQSKIIQ